MIQYKQHNHKIRNRVISALLAFAITLQISPIQDLTIGNLQNTDVVRPITAMAIDSTDEDDPDFPHKSDGSISIQITELVAFSENCVKYHTYHQNDKIKILGTTGDTTYFAAGFKGFGTDARPFAGSVEIENNANVTLNLDAPLFNAVYDTVQLNNGNPIKISRYYDSNRTDISNSTLFLAQTVYQSESGSDETTTETTRWNVVITKPTQDDDPNVDPVLAQFGGLIGTMDSGSKLNLGVDMSQVTGENSDTNPIVISGTGNTGFACGTIMTDANLELTLTGDRKIASVSAQAGDVGGLVGKIEAGTFTYHGSNPQLSDGLISTDRGYAGGIVGENLGGTVVLDKGLTYDIQQHITGTQGAGGVYGRYVVSVAPDISPDSYTINCQVNGDGSTGGLYGIVESTCVVSIPAGSNKIISSHSSGAADCYGGLIGTYIACNTDENTSDSKAHALSIGAVTVKTDNTSGASASFYGGAVGKVDDTNPSYVSINGFAVDTASGTGNLTFGGAIASADNAFVDVTDFTLKSDYYKGGGVIGSLDHGILRLSGYTKLTNARADNPAAGEEKRVGQLVGYRDDALVFAADGWEFHRYEKGQYDVTVDDIGAWGEVLRLNSILSVNETDHTVVVTAPTSYVSIGSKEDFARASLCFSINADHNAFLSFADTSYTWETIKNADISFTDDIDLSGTGITGLTRDNAVGTEEKHVYCGTLSGGSVALAVGEYYGYRNGSEIAYVADGNGKITRAHGDGTIYRHAYNGLVGVSNVTGENKSAVSGIEIKGSVDVCANAAMYVGGYAGRVTGTLKADGATVSTAFTHRGGNTLLLGGITGETAEAVNVIEIANSSFSGSITGDNSDGNSCFAGIIGKISHASNEATEWKMNTVALSGTVENTAARTNQRIGGLIACINGYSSSDNVYNSRKLVLNGVTANGLTVNGTVSNTDSKSGGLLGFSWYNTDVEFQSVTIGGTTGCTVSMDNLDGYGNFAGLVYAGTGNWKVTDLDISNITVNSTAEAVSFGMILNTGWNNLTGSGNPSGSASAIYLLLPTTGCYAITTATFGDGFDTSVYDELIAYSSYYRTDGNARYGYVNDNANDLYVLRNHQGVVSIHTNVASGLTMDGSQASNSYAVQTSKGNAANPHTRYYYNLDSVTNSDSTELTTPQMKMMSWGLSQYAHRSIASNFASVSFDDLEYNMTGYSWYPVDMDSGSITVKGTFTFANEEFEGSEKAKYKANDATEYDRTSLDTPAKTQHYLLHAGIFRNVTGTVNVGAANTETVTFKGNISNANEGSGVLICGTVRGSNANSHAYVNTNGKISLSGIRIGGFETQEEVEGQTVTSYAEYAPLLLNKIDSNSDISISDVFTAKNTNNTFFYPNGIKAASSLIGNAGNDKTDSIKIEFSRIKLDARDTATLDLNDIYNTTRSIFTKATLLNQFSYRSGGTGIYNYEHSKDWDGTTHVGNVTYGLELWDGSAKNADSGRQQYFTLEHKYLSSEYFTSPEDSAATGKYSFAGYLPYVNVAYNKTNKTYQLEVNHSSLGLEGCGTYNDPYTFSNQDPVEAGRQLSTIESILNDHGLSNQTINIPMKKDGTLFVADLAATWCDSTVKHSAFTYKGENTVDGTTHPAGFYLDGTYAVNTSGKKDKYLTVEEVRTYLAGAYYQLGSAMTINDTNFLGLGNTSDACAVFRGVFDCAGYTITNSTQYPLIASSYGSVVKNGNIIVKDATITKTGNTKAFETDESGNVAYGAVIGKILGGDNIIDGVTVSFTRTTINLNGNYAQLVPVGGYVGIVLNGGLIFRGMDEISQNDKAGLPTGIVSVTTPNGDPVNNNNKRWLYVNPIIGRVINGYAVTESDAYRPYEDGTRTYKGGTTDEVRYWDDSQSTEVKTAPTGLRGVTMRNGTKNYSIADIDSDLAKLTASSASAISVPNGQAWFIMSLLVNSGESAKNLGYNQKYQVNRWAKYNEIGSGAKQTGGDYDTAKSDRVDSTNGTEGNRKAKQSYGYLFNSYYNSKYNNNVISLHNTSLTVDLPTVKDADDNDVGGKYYLPDGYKGMGNIYQNDNNYRMLISTLNGNGATISQNTKMYYYFTNAGGIYDTAYTPTDNNSYVGLGFINYQNQNLTASNIGFSGNVIAEAVDQSSNTGAHIPYNASLTGWGDTSRGQAANGIDRFQMAAVGSFIGLVGDQGLTINEISLNNVYVHGLKASGGIIGSIQGNTSKPTTITNTNAKSEKIKVHGGSVCGGFIGRNNQGNLTIDFHGQQYDITEIVSYCEKDINNRDGNYGVGGLIGCTRSRQGNTADTGTLTLKNINIGSQDQKTAMKVSCEKAQLFTGGFVGLLDRTSFEISNCHMYNLDLRSLYYAGGFSGQISTSPNSNENQDEKTITGKLEITNVTIEKTKNYSGTPQIVSTGNAAGGFFGAVKQDIRKNIYVKNCAISGQTIKSQKYSGGVLGELGFISDNSIRYYNGSLILQNFKISDCTINANDAAGGLVGLMNRNKQTGATDDAYNNQYIIGYNILAKNLDFGAYTENGIPKAAGYICGINQKEIKIAGFSRQEDRAGHTMLKELVGECTSSKDNVFGDFDRGDGKAATKGYVIFADYNDTASTEANKQHANIYPCENDVIDYALTGSKTTVTEYTVIAQKDSQGNSIIRDVSMGDSDVSYSDESISELSEGEKDVTISGSKISYENVALSSGDLIQVTSLDELTEDDTQGFYIKNNFTLRDTNNYLTATLYPNDTNNVLKATATSPSDAALWYFELVDSTSNIYKIYTYVGETKKYLSKGIGKGGYLNLYTEAEASNSTDYQFIINSNTANGNIDNGFELHLTANRNGATRICFTYAYNEKGGGYWVDAHNDNNTNTYYNSILTFYKAPTGEQLTLSDFSPTSFSTVEGETITGTISNGAEVSSQERSDYEAMLAEYDNNDHTYEIYSITQTIVENTYSFGDNPSPFVTTNPKWVIGGTKGGSNEQFLTGDGVQGLVFDASRFKQIQDDIAKTGDAAVAKAYRIAPAIPATVQNDGETAANTAWTDIADNYSTSAAVYSHIPNQNKTGMPNFPMLVVSNTNATELTKTINNYLQTLTNTNYNYADPNNSAIYTTALYKCTWDMGNKTFSADTSTNKTANLQTEMTSGTSGNIYRFKMTADNVDTNNETPIFSLIDVQFKDPSGSGKIAYHLYVPVYVKKLLRYDFRLDPESGTDYLSLGIYGADRKTLFENIGNPVTVGFEYEYKRNASEWLAEINAGENILTNYYKSLTLNNHTGTWPAGTKMILVDAANGGKQYYLNTPPGGTAINLYDFTDNGEASGTHYKPAPFNNLMSVNIEPSSDPSSNLVLCVDSNAQPITDMTAAIDVGATVRDKDGKYYRPYDSGNDNEDVTKYAATEITFKGNTTSAAVERYYLTILTPTNENDTTIYHYEISSRGSFDRELKQNNNIIWQVAHWSPNSIQRTQQAHLLLGNLYNNNLTLNVVPRKADTQLMGTNNNWLTVTMTANIGLTPSAIAAGVHTNMGDNPDSTIFQTFLMSYDKIAKRVADGGQSEFGVSIAADASIGSDMEYYIQGGNVAANSDTWRTSRSLIEPDSPDPQMTYASRPEITENYIEFANNQNLINYLADADNQYNHSVSMQVKFDAVYQPKLLIYQFPKNDYEDNTIGASVIGYSNVSSSSESAKYSATSKSVTDSYRYYTTDDSAAVLEYNVVQTNGHITGPYSYLGKNAIELEDASTKSALSYVDTNARYDTRALRTDNDYIEFTLTLTNRKNGYAQVTTGNPDSTSKGLKLSDYLTDLTIYGVNSSASKDNPLFIFNKSANNESTAAMGNATELYDTDGTTLLAKVTQTDSCLTLRIHKRLLNGQGEGIYLLPIDFNVKTGDHDFKSNGLAYSNYMVSITAATYKDMATTDFFTPSYASDHIIYTNTRLDPTVQ